MIVGVIYKKCVDCDKIKDSDDFLLDIVEEDNEESDRVNNTCNECYQKMWARIRKEREKRKGEENPYSRENLKEVLIPIRCPKCDKRGSCWCDRTDNDGYK